MIERKDVKEGRGKARRRHERKEGGMEGRKEV